MRPFSKLVAASLVVFLGSQAPSGALALLAPRAHAGDAEKNPLERAKVGQWAKYKLQNDMEMKQSVTKVDGRKVTLRNEMWMKGSALPANDTVVDLDKKLDAGDRKNETPKVEEDTVTVAGKKLKCRVTILGSVRTWISDEVPVYGVVKQTMEDKVTMELVAWGDTPEK